MKSYVVRRLFETLLVLLVLSFVSYTLMGLMPGDPLDIACAADPKCDPANMQQLRANMGLDRPIWERYGRWAAGFITGDLGYSRNYKRPVTEILAPRLVNTFVLGLSSLMLSLFIAIPLGVWAGSRPNSKTDYLLNFFSFAGISTPSFWLGLMLMMIFSVKLGWFPAGGVESVENFSGATSPVSTSAWLLDRVRHLVLPVTTLSFLTIAGWLRFMRSSMIETLRMDYIRTARAKGLSFARILWIHAGRNALLPVITVVALGFSSIFSGAVITETVFSYQGVGKLMYDSILSNDFNVAMCAFVISCVSVLIMNLLADLCYAAADPRVSLQ